MQNNKTKKTETKKDKQVSSTTIIDDFLKLKALLDKHHRLKRGEYE